MAIESFHWAHTSVFFCYTVDMLVSNNVQWLMKKKHFHYRYGATHKAICLRFTEYAVICVLICKTWTVSCLSCPIVMVKVFFPIYHCTVRCWTQACPPCNRRIWTCMPSENSLYSCVTCVCRQSLSSLLTTCNIVQRPDRNMEAMK